MHVVVALFVVVFETFHCEIIGDECIPEEDHFLLLALNEFLYNTGEEQSHVHYELEDEDIWKHYKAKSL